MHCVIFILMFVVVCILIKRTMDGKKKDNVDKFQSGLDTSEMNIFIDKTVAIQIKEKFNNIKIEKDVNVVVDVNSVPILKNDSPLGHVSYFYQPPSDDHWLPCDGRKIYSDDYPDFFKVINSGLDNPLEKVNQINLPNLVGRMIVGTGTISKTQGTGTANLINSRNNYDINLDTSNADNKKAFRVFNEDNTSFNLNSGDTGGYDYCNDLVSVKGDASSNIKVCKSKSNMPPHINLAAYIKVKHDYYKINY
jgi:hypothetical protein